MSLSNQLHAARETTYGTPVTPTRSFEAQADGHKRQHAYLESVGFRTGLQTVRDDRRRPVNMGSTGTVTVDVQNKGLGMLLRAMFLNSAAASIAQIGTTAAWLQTYVSNVSDVDESLTVQLGREPVTGAVEPFTYHGGTVTSWTLTQEAGGLLVLSLELDYEDDDHTTVLAAEAYPADTRPYGWDDCSVTVDGSPVHVTSLSLTCDNMVNVDRRFLRGSVLKKQPQRSGVPVITGELQAEFENMTHFDRFVAGTVVPIVMTWDSGVAIDTGENFETIVTLQACQFDGDTPEADLADLTRQPLPFKVLFDGTADAVDWDYQSSDTAA